MTATHKNRLKTAISAVASAGLGAFTIDTAASGYRTFAAGDDGLAFDGVLIVEGTAWEVRDGCVYTHSGTSLSRGTLMDSSTGSAVAFTSAAVVSQGGSADWAELVQLAMASVIPGGRLTLESGVPVSASDQTAKTNVYYTPFVHNVVPLWDGYKWVPVEFGETTLALGTLTSGLPYDVFGYLSGGVLALESLVWTDDTTRATAVTLQDGRYCKSGDKTRLLLGTFYTTSTTTTEDSALNRYVGNVYNLAKRNLSLVTNDTGHTWTGTAGMRAYNNSNANRVGVMLSIDGSVALFCGAYLRTSATSGSAQVGWADGSTSTIDGECLPASTSLGSDTRFLGGGFVTKSTGRRLFQFNERNTSAALTITLSYGIMTGDVTS